MIHGNSHDPVLIKRIGLKIWTLRAEVESVVAQTLKAQPEKEKLSAEEIQKIKDEYAYRGPVDQRPNLQLIQGGGESVEAEGEDLEAAMAAAMGGGDEGAEDAPDEPAEAQAEGEEDGEDLEAAMAAAMGGGDEAAPAATPSGPLKVIQRKSENIPEEKIFRGITILGEISMDVIYFFSSEQFLEGQSIVLEFQIPKRFVVNAQVAYCRVFNNRSRIISDKKVSTRVAAKFTFLKDGERTLLRQFIESIEPEVQEAPTKASSESKAEESDDFDGLDDLGF